MHEGSGPDWPDTRGLRAARILLRLGSRLVPFHRRRRWLDEWEGELWMMHERGKGTLALLRFGAAGFGHGFWERREEGDSMLGSAIHDLRSALRRLARSPGFTATTILILALGIGANTALFSALEAALLRPPPYPEADRLVMVDLLLESQEGQPPDTLIWSYPKYVFGRDALTSVEDLAVYSLATLTLTGEGPAVRLNVEYVTPEYFDVLGMRPRLGRLFTADEVVPEIAPVVVLSDALWRDRYGSDPDVIGRTIRLNGASLRIVGVLEEGRAGVTGAADLWVPVAGVAAISGPRRVENAWAHWLTAVGRLAPGVSLAQAGDEARTIGASLSAAFSHPDVEGSHGVAVTPFLRARVNPVARLAVTIVSMAAALFLLIACGNVAGLLLARASARRGDTAVRNALGAGRGRLVGEHLTESLLLGVAGGVFGLVLASVSQRAVASAVTYALDTSGTRNLQFLDPTTMGVGGTTLVIGIAAALLTSLLFGLLPAWHASAVSPGEELRRAGGATLGRRRLGLGEAGRGAMVAGQLVLTLVLLTGAGLMGSSLGRLTSLEPGFTHRNVLTLSYDRGPGASDDEHHLLVSDALDRLGETAGVESVGFATCAPLAGRCEIAGLRTIDDAPAESRSERLGVLTYAVTDRYFETVGIPVIAGRTFAPTDRDAPPVVLVNRAAATEYFGNESPIGHRIAITHELTASELATIVGVVGDVRYADLEEPPMPAVYLSEHQVAMPYGTVLVRAQGDPYALLPSVRETFAELDSQLPLFGVTTMAERLYAASARTRIILWLLAGFAGAGLLLSAIGLYGLVSHGVSARRREVGLRIALGADSPSVLRLLTLGPATLVTSSIAVGALAAWWSSRYLALLLDGGPATRTSPVLLASTVLLATVTAAATLLPATKATRQPPSTTLRED